MGFKRTFHPFFRKQTLYKSFECFWLVECLGVFELTVHEDAVPKDDKLLKKFSKNDALAS